MNNFMDYIILVISAIVFIIVSIALFRQMLKSNRGQCGCFLIVMIIIWPLIIGLIILLLVYLILAAILNIFVTEKIPYSAWNVFNNYFSTNEDEEKKPNTELVKALFYISLGIALVIMIIYCFPIYIPSLQMFLNQK